MLHRQIELTLLNHLGKFPCVAVVGPRQVGKTTLVKTIQKQLSKKSLYLDLELIEDRQKLSNPQDFLQSQQDKCIIIDEIQRLPELFPLLRALIDQNRVPARFILLGSASPDLIRDSSESLAGRISYLELSPFILPEVNNIDQLWFKGGYPDAYLENDDTLYQAWMSSFVRTYVERDLPQLGFTGNTKKVERLWHMLAHYHGNLVNYTELGKSLELSSPTIKNYIDFLEQAFLLRQLKPYTFNSKKRLIKSPKLYLRDSGLLHYFLGLENKDELLTHPKMGSSWEGFVIEQIAALLPLNRELYFYRTREGSEMDLLITKGGKPLAAIEIKYGSEIQPSRGNTQAILDLETKHNFILIKKDEEYNLKNFKVSGLNIFLEKYLPEL